MIKKVLLIFFPILLLTLFLSSCNYSATNVDTDNPQDDTASNYKYNDFKLVYDEFEEYPSEMFGGGEPIVDIFPSPLILKASGVGYISSDKYQIYDEFYMFYEIDIDESLYDKDNFKYIGEVTATVGELDFGQWNSFESNYLPEGTKIYRINAMSLYVEYEHDNSLHRAVGEMRVVDNPPPLIFVENELYVFFNSQEGSRYDTDDLDYLGSVVAVTNKEIRGNKLVPDEEFVSSCFPVGTEIYRIDKDTLYFENYVPLAGSGSGHGNIYSFIGHKYEEGR